VILIVCGRITDEGLLMTAGISGFGIPIMASCAVGQLPLVELLSKPITAPNIWSEIKLKKNWKDVFH